MKAPEIETERLRLRRFRPDDLDALARIVSDAETMRFIGNGETVDREGLKPHLEKFIRNYWEERAFGRWALDHKLNGEMIGHCGFRLLEGEPELVYLLAREHWGMGLATEAAKASLKYAFDGLGLERIVAVTKPNHAVSRRVLEKVGFRFEKETEFYGLACAYFSISRENFVPEDSLYILTM